MRAYFVCSKIYLLSTHLQKPIDLVSTNEALLIRFRSDSTMSLKGFSATYMAVDPVERRENINMKRLELVTPFPGSLKSIYANTLTDNSNYMIDDDRAVAAVHKQFETQ